MTERRRPGRMTRTRAFALPLSAREAFALFTPEGEKAWAEGWEPEYLHPRDGALREGMIFRTRAGGEETVWVLARLERDAFRVEYVRVTPASRAGTVAVRCEDEAGGCRVRVTYALTGLTDAGDDWISSMDEERYAAFIDEWKESIEAFLRRRAAQGAAAIP